MFAIDLGNGLTLEGEVKAGLKVATADESPVIGVLSTYNRPAFNPDAYDSNNDGTVNANDFPVKDDVTRAEDSDNTRLSLWNNDAGANYRARVTANYGGDWGGAKLVLEAINGNTTAAADADNTGGFYAHTYYGWANFLDKKVVVYGGKITDDLWGLGKLPINAFDPNIDTVTGARAAFNIVDGVSFGFSLPLDKIAYDSVYTAPSGTAAAKWTPETANRTLGAVFGGAAFGGLYKSDFISAAAGVKLFPAVNAQDYGDDKKATLGKVYGDAAMGTTGDKKGYAEKAAGAQIIAGVSVKPIAPLTVVLDADVDTRKYDDSNTYFGNQTIGYALIGLKGEYVVIPALKASLKLDVLLQNDSAERYTKNTSSNPFAQYYAYSTSKPDDEWGKIKKTDYVKYRAVENYGDTAVGIEIRADYTVSDTIAAYLRIGSDNLLWIAGDVALNKTDVYKSTYSPGAGVWVRPGVKITLGTSSIEIFDKLGGIGATDLEYFYYDLATTTTKIGSTSAFTNQFQVDFNWKF
ncbi:MAG: hypothetical protein LBT00_13260 [Spirochaetaceae bacterium]|jgi:hypothetical protein|nr:hypothetical protein [Spirochaetaceae bacterium]